MKQIQRIIYQEIRGPILISLLILTFVVFTREFGRLAELFIQQDAQLELIGQAIIYLMPSILIFTVPFAFLIGTLIGFSRLSSDSEVIAMRAGGVSVFQMLWPVLKVGLAVSAITALFTLSVLPHGNWQLRLLRHEIRLAPVYSQIKPRVFFEEFPGVLIYLEDIDLETSVWKGVFLVDTSNPEEQRIILAQEGRVLESSEQDRIQLHFEEGSAYTFPEQTPDRINISRFGTLDIPITIQRGEPAGEKEKRYRDKSLTDLLVDLRMGPAEDFRTSLVELNRRVALPLSGLIFAVLSVTLGFRTPRGGRGYGFMLSVVIAFTYYILFATGSTLSRGGVLPITVGVWGANIVMGLLALITLRCSDSDLPFFHRLGNAPAVARILLTARRIWRSLRLAGARLLQRFRRQIFSLPRLRLRLARVIDLYLMRIFARNFITTLLVCLFLVCLFTFFEVIDDVLENQIAYSILVDYFFFLQPHFLMLLVPIAILIATLVTFGSLEKSNQMVAFKSCGVSVYRTALPIFALGVIVSIFTFLMQEHVLPYANQRQDSLRNRIKGHPAQTTQPGRHWIFGEDGRLYHYNIFAPDRNQFLELSVYHTELGGSRLLAAHRAERAVWSRSEQSWVFQEGWTRSFTEQEFSSFDKKSFSLPENPDFFDEEVRDSSKMTYQELSRYIDDLQTGGFEVDYLRTELYKKLSFPVVNFIMTLLGLPFALTMGRKGALYGIAAGVMLGIAYWGAFGVFDVLGSNGLLAPVLAAWGPNLVFGSGASILLTGVRT